MLTRGDVDIRAVVKRGWSISAVARHIGRHRKTVKAHLDGKRHGGVRAQSVTGQAAGVLCRQHQVQPASGERCPKPASMRTQSVQGDGVEPLWQI